MMADYRKNILDLILGPYPMNAKKYPTMMILIYNSWLNKRDSIKKVYLTLLYKVCFENSIKNGYLLMKFEYLE